MLFTNPQFSWYRVLRLLGFVFSTMGLVVSMTGLFLPWFTGPRVSPIQTSIVTGLDFIAHGFLPAIISYTLAWTVYLIYCFKPSRIWQWAIVFTLVFPIFYLDCWVSLVEIGWRTGLAVLLGRGGTTFDYPFSSKQGFWISWMGMSLLVIGVFVGMNSSNRKRYLSAAVGGVPIVFICYELSIIPFLLLIVSLVGALISLKTLPVLGRTFKRIFL